MCNTGLFSQASETSDRTKDVHDSLENAVCAGNRAKGIHSYLGADEIACIVAVLPDGSLAFALACRAFCNAVHQYQGTRSIRSTAMQVRLCALAVDTECALTRSAHW